MTYRFLQRAENPVLSSHHPFYYLIAGTSVYWTLVQHDTLRDENRMEGRVVKRKRLRWRVASVGGE